MIDHLIKYTGFIKTFKKKVEIRIQEGVSFRDNKASLIIVVNEEDAKKFIINFFYFNDMLYYLDNIQLPKENFRLSVASIYEIKVS